MWVSGTRRTASGPVMSNASTQHAALRSGAGHAVRAGGRASRICERPHVAASLEANDEPTDDSRRRSLSLRHR
jgi:hypothetical protein